MARTYRQEARRNAAAEMRRRIVRATFELHAEQGIVGTTMKQIAERAGVSVGSVYNHFPTYDQAIQACGAYAFSLGASPTPALFEGVSDRAERVRRAAASVYAQFERLRAFGYVIAEQEQLPVLKPVVEQERQARVALAAAALGQGAPGMVTQDLAALLDHGVYRAFRDAGLSAEASAARVADIANAWLDRVALESRNP